MTITEFLLARIAEDEEVAREGAPTEWAVTDPPRLSASLDDVYGTGLSFNRGAARHIERWDPARVLAECQAKRAIVEMHAPGWPEDDDRYTFGWEDAASVALRTLATVYADHPDFDEGWRI